MNIQSQLIYAIDTVLDRDIPDEAFTEAVQAQVCLMARVNSDEVTPFCLD